MNGDDHGAMTAPASNWNCTTMELCVGSLHERIGIHAVCVPLAREPSGPGGGGLGVIEALGPERWWLSEEHPLNARRQAPKRIRSGVGQGLR